LRDKVTAPHRSAGTCETAPQRAGGDRAAYKEKMTGYWAWLLDVFVSPGTGFTSTLTVVGSTNGGWPRSLNSTTFCSLGLIRSIVSVFEIGVGWVLVPWMVRVTTTEVSGDSPEFSTVTSKARSLDDLIVVSVSLASVGFPGATTVATTPTPSAPA